MYVYIYIYIYIYYNSGGAVIALYVLLECLNRFPCNSSLTT